MLFHIRCKDKPGQMNMRASTRSAHLNYINSFGDLVLFAGPTSTDDGETITGSVFIIELESMSAAEDFAKGDPYRKMGLFETVEIAKELIENSMDHLSQSHNAVSIKRGMEKATKKVVDCLIPKL